MHNDSRNEKDYNEKGKHTHLTFYVEEKQRSCKQEMKLKSLQK